MATPNALVIGHSKTAGLRRFGPYLREAGLDFTVMFGGDGLPPHLDGYAALMVLGGAPLPDEDDRFPWLPATRALTREALQRQIPFLGICLGGQLLAYVGGGSVEHRRLLPEHGMTTIDVDPAAASDPLFRGMPQHFPMAENHVDHIMKLPDTAVLLAHSDRSPVQAFRMGRQAWGLQFHPEVATENIADWDLDERREVRADGFDWTELMKHAYEVSEDNARMSQRLAHRFAQICAADSAERDN